MQPQRWARKGGVEGLVGYARRNYMVPVPRAESLEALNDKLLSDCMAYGDHRIAGREQSVTEIFYGSKRIAVHNRLYGNNKWSLEPDHYLELIQQRSQSFDTARPILQWRKTWPQCLEKLLELFCNKQGNSKGIKDFISVLMFYKDFGAVDIQTAVEQAPTADAGSSAAVEHILRHWSKPCVQFETVSNWQCLAPADVSVYQQIGGDI